MESSASASTMTPAELLGRPLNDVEQKFAPPELYVVTGRHIPVPSPRFGIVGSRKATPKGIELAAEIVSFLVKKAVIIVSGLAEGIDTSAHETAIKLGGMTMAVLGTPLNEYYPAQNAELQRTIMREQWAISQFPLGHRTRPRDFVLRNRTMALLSDASLIVEAGETSGSLHQAWESLRLGRPVFISEIISKNTSLKWPRKMMDYGASLLDSPEEILEVLPSAGQILKISV
jgi:DNA processing protein